MQWGTFPSPPVRHTLARVDTKRDKPAPVPDAHLIAQAQAGDTGARNALIERHMGFIYRMIGIALRARGKHNAELDEYMAVAVEAFARAIVGFDLTRGLKLLTYAGISIQRSVSVAVRNNHIIRLPTNFDLCRDRTLNQRRSARRVASIDDVPRGYRRARGVSVDTAADPVDDADERLAVLGYMRYLVPREREVLERRARGETLAEIGLKLSLTKERVRQLESKALAKMRRFATKPPVVRFVQPKFAGRAA